MSRKKKAVLVSLWMHSCAGRRHLAGVFRYIARGSDWDVRLCRMNEISEKMIAEADGIITATHVARGLIRTIQRRDIPLVTIDIPESELASRGPKSCIYSDDRSVGAALAGHVLSYGNFRSYGFVSDGSSHWALLRQEGAARALADRQKPLAVYSWPGSDEAPQTDLSGWLKSLSKPAVVMAATDALAIDVLAAARAARLRVPKDLAVAGTDDDELLCEYAKPRLTSIRPGHEACGYAAAEELDRLFRGKPPQTRLIPFEAITDRKSLAACVPATHLIEAATDYIGRHACEGATVNDVARALGVSRRLLSLRHAECERRSVHDALVDRRLAEVKKLLRRPSLSIAEISSRSGFPNANYLKRLFKRRTGKTMREWRRADEP